MGCCCSRRSRCSANDLGGSNLGHGLTLRVLGPADEAAALEIMTRSFAGVDGREGEPIQSWLISEATPEDRVASCRSMVRFSWMQAMNHGGLSAVY